MNHLEEVDVLKRRANIMLEEAQHLVGREEFRMLQYFLQSREFNFSLNPFY